MQNQATPITTTDGIPLKVSLRRAERKNKVRSFLFVVPTLLLILFAFLIPIFDMLILSVHTPEVIDLLPNTVKALERWDGTTGLPDETAFAPGTAVIGAFYAWLYLLMDEAAIWTAAKGFDPDTARQLVLETVAGACAMAVDQDALSLSDIWKTLATPGGISEQGAGILSEGGGIKI